MIRPECVKTQAGVSWMKSQSKFLLNLVRVRCLAACLDAGVCRAGSWSLLYHHTRQSPIGSTESRSVSLKSRWHRPILITRFIRCGALKNSRRAAVCIVTLGAASQSALVESMGLYKPCKYSVNGIGTIRWQWQAYCSRQKR